MARYYFEVFADYFMFDLLDDGVDRSVPTIEEEDLSDRVIVSEGAVTIMTARNMSVPMLLEIGASPPGEAVYSEIETWDHIVECSIRIKSGRLAIWGNGEYYPDCPRVSVEPGTYEVRIFHGGLTTLSEDELDGNDVYWVVLTPGQPIEKKVIKRFSG
jgi:hypothetical protein